MRNGASTFGTDSIASLAMKTEENVLFGSDATRQALNNTHGPFMGRIGRQRAVPRAGQRFVADS